ncbi:MAG: hypothetical protein KIS96_11065 [Bauldia sp.]|nr:hypothetical protein [Bauldia sp.]
MHHKRKGPKSTRSGCLLCKMHKRQGYSLFHRQRFSAARGLRIMAEKVSDATARTRPGSG